MVVSRGTLMLSMRCSSDTVPSVVVTSAWVCPRVKRADPCVRGSIPASQVIGRTVFRSRPSTRSPWSSIWLRIARDSMSPNADLMSPILSGSSSPNCSTTAVRTVASACIRSAFSLWFRASTMRSPATSSTRCTTSAGGSTDDHSIFGTAAASMISCCIATTSTMPCWAKARASATSPSVSSRHPPSTIMIESVCPDTTRSISLSPSCSKVGL